MHWLRWLKTWSPSLFAVMLFGAYLFVGDRVMLGEWITIWPPLLWGGLLVIRGLLLLVERKRKAAAITAGLGLLLPATMTESRSLFRREDTAARKTFENARVSESEKGRVGALRIVVWNVAGGAPLAAVEPFDPDICMFQEIGNIHAAIDESSHWRGFDFLGNYDPGILSRHELALLETERVGPWQEPLLALMNLPNGRSVILANVRLAFPSIVVAAASFGSGLASDYGYRERIEQYSRLARIIEDAMRKHGTRAVILAGDFNVPARLPSLDPLRGMLRDVWLHAGIGWGGTMTAGMPLARIDQCWVSDEIDVVSARVSRSRHSDHRMLVVDLLVP